MISESFDKKYAQLNAKQKQAVDTIQGPVLVVAGPGTGKTQVLALRIANILRQPGVNPENILCITFTEAGVSAMRKRLHSIIGKAAHRVHIHTFHGFCNDVIQTFPDKFVEFSRSPLQVTDLMRVKIIRQILDELEGEQKYQLRPFHNPYTHQTAIISALQVLKREGVSVDDFSRVAAEELEYLRANPDVNKRTGKNTTKYDDALRVAEKNSELAEIYVAYQQALSDNNYYDYEDMILLVIEKLQNDEELLATYAERFLYIHIDEYQDTNGAQNQLIKLLGSVDPDLAPNIFAVGDDDQAIYRFQGANVDNLLFFEQQFRQVTTIVIDENYRSSQAILNFAEEVITQNKNRLVNLVSGLQKKLKAGGADAKLAIIPVVAQFANEQEENRYLVQKTQELIASGIPAKEIAILYRRHADAESIIDAFWRAGVPVQLAAGNNALLEREVQMLVNLLRVIAAEQPQLDKLLSEILFYDFLLATFKIPRVDIFKLLAFLGKHNYATKRPEDEISILSALGDANLHDQIGLIESVQLIELHKSFADWRSAAVNKGVAELVIELLQQTGLLSKLTVEGADTDKLSAVRAFYNFVRNSQLQKADLSIADLLADLKLLEENRIGLAESASSGDSEGVNLMTAHGSKGLEFEHVFIAKVYDGNWGGKTQRQVIKLPQQLVSLVEHKDKEEKAEIQEEDERRLFFVAITRARKSLTVTNAALYENDRVVEQSKLLSNIASEVFDSVQQQQTDSVEESFVNLMQPLPEFDLEARERDFLTRLLEDFALSASSLNEYIRCPLQFKFNRLLRIPQPTDVALALGNATHRALELHGRSLLLAKEHTIEQILTDFQVALYTERLNREDYKRTLTEGQQMLREYFAHYGEIAVVPAAVEYNFSRHNVMLDLPEQEAVKLVGKIDRLEWTDQQSSKVKIIDYKTGSPKSDNEIKGLTKNGTADIWRQLVFYQLLANLDPEFRPVNKLQKYIVDHVEVDFLKPNSSKNYQRRSFQINDSDVQNLIAEIAKVMKHIRALDFYGSEDFPLCGECEYCKTYSPY